MALGIVSVILSGVLIAIELLVSRAQEVWPGLQLPLVAPGEWLLPAVGYILTPMFVIVAQGWDRTAVRSGLLNKNFVVRSAYSSTLKYLLIPAMLMGLWHVINLAFLIGSSLSESWGAL